MTMGLSPYEQVKIGYMQSKKPSGAAIGGLVTAVGAAVRAVGAGAWAGAQAKNAKDVAIAKNDGLKDAIEHVLKLKVINLKTDPQLMGALGAAEFARQKGQAK